MPNNFKMTFITKSNHADLYGGMPGRRAGSEFQSQGALIILWALVVGLALNISCRAATPEPVLLTAESPISPLSPPTRPNNSSLPATSTAVLLLPTPTLLTTSIHATPSSEEEGLSSDKPKGKLSFRLQLLADPVISKQDAEAQAQILSLPANGPGSLLRNESGELLVYIRLTDTSKANLAALAEVGATVTHVAEAYRTVTVYISPTQLSALANMDIVESVQEVLRP